MSSFPKRDRLLKSREFEALRGNARSKGNRFFRLRWIAKERRRLGVIVSAKVAKAYRRNLIKRIVRECFRLHKDLFPLGDVIVIASPEAGKLERKAILEKLNDALSA